MRARLWTMLVVAGCSVADRRAFAQDAPDGDDFQARLVAAMARPGGLTSAEAQRRADATSFDVEAKALEVRSAEATRNQAVTSLFPRLALTGRYTRYSEITPPTLGVSVVSPGNPVGPIPVGARLVNVPLSLPVQLDSVYAQVAMTLPVSDYLFRLTQSYSATEHSLRAAELNRDAQRLITRANASVAYYQWSRSVLSEVVAAFALRQSQQHLHDVTASYQAGASSQADVLQVQAQVAANEQLVARAKHLRAASDEQLRIVMHVERGPDFQVGEDVATPLSGDYPGLDALYSAATSRRLELRALRETVRSLDLQADVTRASAFPRLDAIGEITTANPNPRYIPPQDQFYTTWSVGVQLTWSPNDALGGAYATTSARARARETEAQSRALVDALRNEVVQAYQAWQDALSSIDTSKRQLAAAQEAYRVRRSLFRVGRATSVELTDAESNLLSAQLSAINATIDQRIARVRLDHAVGRDVGVR